MIYCRRIAIIMKLLVIDLFRIYLNIKLLSKFRVCSKKLVKLMDNGQSLLCSESRTSFMFWLSILFRWRSNVCQCLPERILLTFAFNLSFRFASPSCARKHKFSGEAWKSRKLKQKICFHASSFTCSSLTLEITFLLKWLNIKNARIKTEEVMSVEWKSLSTVFRASWYHNKTAEEEEKTRRGNSSRTVESWV